MMMSNPDYLRSSPPFFQSGAPLRGQAAPSRVPINRYQQGPLGEPAFRSASACGPPLGSQQVSVQDPLLRSTRAPPARFGPGSQQDNFPDGHPGAAAQQYWPARTDPASSSSPRPAYQVPVSVPVETLPPAIPGPEVGWYTRQGLKPGNPNWVNQDSQLAMQLPGDRLLVGVFDGHGEHGHRASGCAKAIMTQLAPSILGAPNAGPAALRQMFAQVQAEFRSQDIFQHSGCTATIALIDPIAGVAAVAHVGDSTLALYHGGNLSFETYDHRIDEAAEHRIKMHGGAIQTVGAHGSKRVYVPDNGRGYAVGLSLDRSLGDLDLAQAGVIGEPEVKANLPFHPGTLLIIASDGVWDVVTKAQAVQLVSMADIEESAHNLVDTARARWAAGQGQIDDITAVVVKW